MTAVVTDLGEFADLRQECQHPSEHQRGRHGALALCPVVHPQGPTLGQSDKAQSPAQASTPPRGHAALTALMPQPRSVDDGDGLLHVKGGFQVRWLGYRNSMLDRAVLRFQNDIARRTGPDVGRASPAELRIDCRGDDKGYLTVDAREHYSLTVTGDAAVLAAEGQAGVLRGLATLRQSITNAPEGFAIPAMVIDDAPRFVWRGIMIDVARHFISLPTLRRQIDAMELVKLNVLHLHLSDNEGFRIESRLYPKLHERSSQFYSQTDVRELVSYAADRGVRIVPEFDVPGHSLALLRAYPELASGEVENRDYFSAMGSALNPAEPGTFTFLERLFGEMAALFPDPCFHVGGDEISGADWAVSPQVQDFMKAHGLKTKEELESYFFERVREGLRAHGKNVIGWEEVARSSIPDDVLVQTWRSSSAVARVTAQGNRVIATCGYYLDNLWPAENHYRVDPFDPTSCGLTHEQLAEAKEKGVPAALVAEDAVIDPSVKMSLAQQALVLGGEGALWTEIVTDEMLDGRIWPGAAVVAERLWSPPSVRDTAEMYRRLIAVVHDGLRVAGLADDANRRRMAARLAPGESEPVALLLDLVSPVRNHAHNHGALALLKGRPPTPQELNELADAASTDSLVARRFALDAERFVRGDRSVTAALRADLASWRNNHDRFAVVARARPQLEAALPISADIAALAGIGLDAVAAIESGRAPGSDWRRRAQELLDRQAAAEKASESIIQAVTMQQPPADLLVSITPGVRTLVAGVVSLGP